MYPASSMCDSINKTSAHTFLQFFKFKSFMKRQISVEKHASEKKLKLKIKLIKIVVFCDFSKLFVVKVQN